MALIKCPKCGEEVSSLSNFCPNCGHPLQNDVINSSVTTNNPNPLDPKWVNHYKKKLISYRLSSSIAFGLSLGALITFGILYNVEKLESLFIPFVIFIIISVIALIYFLGTFLGMHIKTKEVDGYTILVYAGLFKNTLVIENNVVESSFSRYLDGKLPNSKQVKVGIAFWDGSIKIDII